MSQDSTLPTRSITFSVFADLYYAYDFSNPANHLRPSFLYNYNRHNEFNLNLGLVRASYNDKRVRANLGLMAGTYAQYNMAAEPELLRHVYDANAGVNLLSDGNLWIDVGIIPSHLGYESVISKDDWTLTRNLASENSPYYETGARISYTNKKNTLTLSGFILNGWQRIQRPEGNNTPAFGTQISYTPSEKLTLNWSSFVGNDKPDSVKQWRYFNDFYAIIKITEKLGLTLGFDIGQEQKSTGSDSYNTWYTPNMVLRYKFNDDWTMAARVEYYQDKHGVIIYTGSPNGFKTFGTSLNIDRKIGDHFHWRTEFRSLNSKDPIFQKDVGSINSNTAITSSFAVSF